MRKIFTLFLKSFLLSLFGIFIATNVGAQTAPGFTEYTAEIMVGKGSQVVFIPNVLDNDDGSQTITFNSSSSSVDTVVSVDSIVYDGTYNLALLYVTEHKVLASSDITIEIEDPDGIFTGVVTVDVVSYPTDAEDGFNYEYYNKAHWKPEPEAADVPAPGSYEVIPETNGPNQNMAKDFFWQLMYGYVIPKQTGVYILYAEGNEGGTLRMNLDDGVIQEKSALTLLGSDPGHEEGIISDPVFLEAGKPYFVWFSGRDIVNNQPFWIKWAGPGFPSETLITSEYLKTAVDFIKPSVPQNFQVVRTGVDFMYLGWNSSTDNNKIRGYNVFVNGELVAEEITDTFYNVTGLSPNTDYTFTITSVDNYTNYSDFAPFIQHSTYDTDDTDPSAPTGLMYDRITSDAVKLVWTEATDGETEIRGYIVYRDGAPLNTVPVLAPEYVDSDLFPENNYEYEVTAVDAGLNESVESNLLAVQTTKFDIEGDPPFSKNYKARVSFELEAIDQFPGMGVQIQYGKKSVLSGNSVPFGNFEHQSFANGLSAANKKDGSDLSFTQEDDNPYSGNYCAKLSGATGKKINCYFSQQIHGSTYNYIIHFACRKDPLYTGDVQIKLHESFVSNVHTETITPTDDWQLYEIEIDPGHDGVQGGWRLEFSLQGAAGTIYLDEIEFHVAEHYQAGNKFSLKGIELLEELQPSGVRWGGIGANYENLNQSIGPWAPSTMTYADMVEISNKYCGGYTFYSIGCNSDVDWYKNPSTFTKFIDYLNGDNTTIGGQARIDEGYDDLMSDAKQVIIEYGNEVWGFNSHQDAFSNYTEYGNWSRDMEQEILESDFFDPDKMVTAYSGRSPGINYGLHQDLLADDDRSIDYLSLSGYMGGNLGYEPGIDFGEAVEDYHKNGYKSLLQKIDGIETDKKEVLQLIGRPLPFYFYEGNMTTSSYYGTVGQGLTFTDYYTGLLRKGAAHAVTFILNGGQWTLIKDRKNFEKYPLFYGNAAINQNCKGINLVTNMETNRVIKDSDGKTINLDPVGAYAFYTDSMNSHEYAIALFNRDILHDYQVQIDIPDELGVAVEAKRVMITGWAVDTTVAIVTTDSITFGDSVVVDVPAYSMIVLAFNGDKQTFEDVPLADMDYTPINSVTIVPDGDPVIDEDGGLLILNVETAPADAFVSTVKWEFITNDVNATGGDYTNNAYLVKGSSECDGDGTILLRASAVDNPDIYDEVTVTVSNQKSPGGCPDDDPVPGVFDETDDLSITLFPNPVNNELNVQLHENVSGNLVISNVHGSVVLKENITSSTMKLNISELKSGVYMLRVENSSKVFRFIKE